MPPSRKRSTLTPERRVLFDRIVRLRDSIGRVDFDVVRELRKMRGAPNSEAGNSN